MAGVHDLLLLPTAGKCALLGPLFVALSAAALSSAAWLRVRGWRVGYTRKVFHILTFAGAAVAQGLGGRAVLNLFGGATTLVLVLALVRGAGHPLYEAIAREKDAPHRTWYIVVPYLATLLGGVVATAISPEAAVLGFLVCGLGDAAGEPVGTRFGRHRYRVPAPGRVASFRTLEGSAAVFVVSWAALLIGLALLGSPVNPGTVAIAAGIALASALTEAVAPHGGDNLLLIVVPAGLASAWSLV